MGSYDSPFNALLLFLRVTFVCSVSFQEIVGIVQILDPEGKGKINFEEFCSGVQQISEIHAGESLPSHIWLAMYMQIKPMMK